VHYFIYTFSLFLSLSAFGRSQEILVITSDVEPIISHVNVISHNGSFQRLTLVGRLNGEIRSNRSFSQTQLQNGVVAEQKEGRDIVIFKAHEFHEIYGGQIEVQFLVNGLTRSYDSLRFDLLKDGDRWTASIKGRSISELKLHGNRKLGKIVGIARISN
jgi:hypothetical protein